MKMKIDRKGEKRKTQKVIKSFYFLAFWKVTCWYPLISKMKKKKQKKKS